jgi:hypothetical protein
MHESREHILKNIVYEINEFIKKTRKINQQKDSFNVSDFLINSSCQSIDSKNKLKCEGFFLKFENNSSAPTQYDCRCTYIKKMFQNLNSNNIAINKIESHWPLKKGMVDTKFLAWHTVPSINEGIQFSIAFMIKCISVSIYKNHKSKSKIDFIPDHLNKNIDTKYLFYFNKIISNKESSLFFWSEIKKYYLQDINSDYKEKKLRSYFYSNILPKKKLIVLCFEESFFRLRSGTNFELFAFEQFINDMISSDNSLVIFSTQKLLQNQSKNENFISDYSVSFKKNLDEQKISIQQAMEPDYKIARDERFIEPNRVGAFDRLIELLAKGQNFINSLEKDFLEWKIKIGN